MVPTESIPFPLVVVIVAGTSFCSHIREDKELRLMLYGASVPIPSLGIAGQPCYFLYVCPCCNLHPAQKSA